MLFQGAEAIACHVTSRHTARHMPLSSSQQAWPEPAIPCHAALEKSGVLERLVAMAAKRVSSFGPSELTFVLDGMARLEVKAPAAFMSALALWVIVRVHLANTSLCDLLRRQSV